MAEPKQKSLDIPPFLRRYLPNFLTPMWVEAARWRNVVRNEPVAIICRDRLIAYAQASPWDIRAKKIEDQEALEPDIAYYKDYILRDFDTFLDLMWQDTLDLPAGGNSEIVRWPKNVLPSIEDDGEIFKVTRPWGKGHVYKLVHIDGATIIPTHDPEFPAMQKLQNDMNNPVVFGKNEIGRILLTPRPELKVRGYSMPPPQRVYMAITLAYYGNQYYAKLLLDTPEAGILDLLDMSRKDAKEWVDSYQTLLQGVDPLKIGVLYQHNSPAKWIPFGRPPSEMMYDTTTTKNNRVITAGYWLTLADIGLDPSGKTLAGEIRRQRETRLTGFGVVKEKTKNYMNRNVIPPYLVFDWIERDDEAIANMGRARLLNAQALKAMVEGQLITALDGQNQLKRDGLLTVELQTQEAAQENGLALPTQGAEGKNGKGEQGETGREVERVPPSQGGRGDVGQTQRATLGDPSISAVEPGSSNFDRLGLIFRKGFNEVLKKMGDTQLRRLIKAALKEQFPLAQKAIINLSQAERGQWLDERQKSWFGEPSIFDDIPQVQKIDQAILDQLEELLNKDQWWKLPPGMLEQILEVLELAYSEGATVAAELLQQFLYEEGLVNSPDLPIGFNFELKNPVTLGELNTKAADLVRHVNNGTKTYLKRIITAGVDEGVSSQEIALRIQEGQDLDQILKDTQLVPKVTDRARKEIEGLSEARITSIVNTEINRAETEGRIGQWAHSGLTKKRWAHTGTDVPCKVCTANIGMGFVKIDFFYPSVFGDGTVLGPPGHPQVCHCHIEFDEKELIAKAGSLDVWSGA